MSYPDYPSNRLVVNGVDLSTEYGLILADGYTLEPPEPKTYAIDIPGGNGKVDLTETLLGDTAYNNRKQEFTFYVINPANFESTKTRLSNFLHGKRYQYTMTMDPGYTYEGRFTVSSYTHGRMSLGILGAIQISIEAVPFKYLQPRDYSINAIGGIICNFQSGRERVKPVVSVENSIKVIYDGALVILPAGSWTLNNMLFTNGTNTVYFNSYGIYNLTWGDLRTNSVTWGEFKEHPLFEWYKSSGEGPLVYNTWSDVSGNTWEGMSGSSWGELSYLSDAPVVNDVDIKYEWGDL